jgi:hypothetical protein
MSKTTDDEKLALAFLAGYFDFDQHELPVLMYLPVDSNLEKAARAALVRLLVSRELSGELCHALALLFDAEALDQIARTPVSAGRHWNARYRKIVLERHRGAPSRKFQRSHIANIIWMAVCSGMTLRLAKKHAARTYSRSDHAIDSIWKEWGREAQFFFPKEKKPPARARKK